MEMEDEVHRKDKDLVTLVARICDPVTGVACPIKDISVNGVTTTKHQRKKVKEKILKSFTRKELISWILENTKAANRQEACQIAQSLVDAGFLSDPTKEGISIMDDDAIYRVPKEKHDEIKCVFRHSPNKTTASRSMFAKSKNGVGLFGCELSELLVREKRDIPSFMASMISYLDTNEVLDTEGIFRIAPNMIELARLKDVLDTSEGPIDFHSFNFKTPHLITGLLKAWLRQLKVPLAHPFESFSPLAEQVIPQKRITVCRQLVEKLPKGYAMTLDYLIGFLHRVVKHSEKNKMSNKSLASVVGPNILRRSSPSPLSLLKDMNDANAVVSLLIEEYATIFANVRYMDDYKASLYGLDDKVTCTVSDTSTNEILSSVLTIPEECNTKSLTRKASMLIMQKPEILVPRTEKRPEILASTFEGIKISELLNQMVSPGGVKIKNRKYHLKTYRNVAVGSKILDWLIKKYNWKREKVVELLQQIMDAGYIQSTPWAAHFKEGHFYVFLIDEGLPELPYIPVVPEEEFTIPPIRLKPNSNETKSPKLSPRVINSETSSPKNSLATNSRNSEIPTSPKINLHNSDGMPSPRNNVPANPSDSLISTLPPTTSNRRENPSSPERPRYVSDSGYPGTGTIPYKHEVPGWSGETDTTEKSGVKAGAVKRPERVKVPKINLGTNQATNSNKTSSSLTTRIERGRSEGMMQKRRVNKLTSRVDNNVIFDEKSEIWFRQVMTTLLDPDTPEGWALVGYKTSTLLFLQAQGNGGVEELVQELKDDEVQYALIRLSLTEGDMQHTRNVFVVWVGPDVLPFEKGRKRSHTGKVSQMFQPFHAELSAVSKQNFTRDRVLKLTGTNGTHTID